MSEFVVFLFCFGAAVAGIVPEFQLKESNVQLRNSIDSNQTSEVSKLIEDGVNVNFKYGDGKYPIHLAVETGSLEIVKLLIDNGAETNTKDNFNRTSIYLAARKARPDIVTELIENGANVSGNPTLLHWAINGGDLAVIKLLISNGADVSDNQLLHHAIAEDRADIVELLIDIGANVNGKAEHNKTPLHSAVLGGNIDIIKLILRNGVENIDAIDNSGTPLFYLALNPSITNNREIAKILIKNGANLYATGNGQFTFYQWAEKDNFFFKKLQEAMAKQEIHGKPAIKY